MPLNFQLSVVSSSVLMANWTPPSSPNGIVTGYTVYCTISQNQTYPEQVPTGASTYTVFNVTSQTSVYLSGLLPFTFYQCYVTANTTVGEGGPSIARLSQTNQAGNTKFYQNQEYCKYLMPHISPPRNLISQFHHHLETFPCLLLLVLHLSCLLVGLYPYLGMVSSLDTLCIVTLLSTNHTLSKWLVQTLPPLDL